MPKPINFILFLLITSLFCGEAAGNSAKASELFLLGEYEQLSGNMDLARDYYVQSLDYDSTSASIYLAIADLDLQANRLEQAVPMMQKAQQLDPENQDLLSRLLNLYAYLGRIEEAETFLHNQIAINPQALIYRKSLVELQVALQKWPELIDSYADLYLLSDFNFQYLDALLKIGLSTMDLETTLHALARILEAEPEDADALSSYIVLLHLFNNEVILDEGLLYLNLLVGNKNLVRRQLAQYCNQKQDFTAADSLYQILITEVPDADIYNNFAYNLSTRNNIDAAALNYALELAGKALDLEADNPAFLDTVGWIYFRLKKYDLAAFFIRQSLEIKAEDPVVLEHLGDILFTTDKKKEALQNYSRALELDPENKVLKHKIDQLRSNDE